MIRCRRFRDVETDGASARVPRRRLRKVTLLAAGTAIGAFLSTHGTLHAALRGAAPEKETKDASTVEATATTTTTGEASTEASPTGASTDGSGGGSAGASGASGAADAPPPEKQAGAAASPNWRGNRAKGQALRDLMMMFTDPRLLDSKIDGELNPRAFWERYSPLLNLDATATFINHLPEAKRREVKARLASVCSHLEGVECRPVEASDWSIEQRRYKLENNAAQGKTGLFVVMFKQILDLIYGKETLEKAMEAGREKHRVQELLKEYGVYRDVPLAKVDQLVQELSVVDRRLPGFAFSPEDESSERWPDIKQTVPEDVERQAQRDRIVNNFLAS